MIVRDMNFLRRGIGQVIVASAVMEDTMGWIIIAITFSLARHGTIDLPSLAESVLGTGVFLFVSLTVGRVAVYKLIRHLFLFPQRFQRYRKTGIAYLRFSLRTFSAIPPYSTPCYAVRWQFGWQRVGDLMAGRKKRRGDIGPVRASREGVEWLKVPQPDTKEDLERHHAEQFVAVFNQAVPIPGFQILEVCQRPENSLDFLLKTSAGDKWLDLMEIAPFEMFDVPPDQAPSHHNSYDMATFLHRKVMEKSRKYRSAKSKGIFLLLYLTDWRFSPAQTMVALLQYWSNRKTHSFEAIFILGGGSFQLIAPTPSEFWRDFDPEKYRDSSVINLNPSKWEMRIDESKD